MAFGAQDCDLSRVLPSDRTAAGRSLISHYLFTPWFDVTQFPLLSVLEQ
ncbi:hypothetical protein [Sphingomicrobium nitratireducens]|nr:hypothetical protein [Sphingomicrobium nitratireducens]